MKVEVYDQTNGVTERPEVWVRVLSDEVVDLPQVRKELTPEQAALLGRCALQPDAYYPHTGETETGHRFEDWWVFKVRPTSTSEGFDMHEVFETLMWIHESEGTDRDE